MGVEGSPRSDSRFRMEASRSTGWRPFPACARSCVETARLQVRLPAGALTLDDKALCVNMLLICNFENKIETSCILNYKMKCDALYTI